MQELDDPVERDKFQSTIPAQLALIWNTLQAGDEGAAQEALELFIEIAEAHPRFLRRNLPEIATAMLQVFVCVLLYVNWAQCCITCMRHTAENIRFCRCAHENPERTAEELIQWNIGGGGGRHMG